MAGVTTSWDYEERVVAFIDVLGYKALTALPDAEVKRVVELISRSLGAPRFDPGVNPVFTSADCRFSARVFSDCIYLSDEVSEQGCRNVVTQAASLAQDLAVEGIYVRGGITSGRHFQDVNIIFGEGIVRAYDIERIRAKHPRIVVEPAIVGCLSAHIRPLISMDDDREHFIDFWRYWKWDHSTTDADLQLLTDDQKYAHMAAAFKGAKARLDVNLKTATEASAPDVVGKLKWLAQYQNQRARELLNSADASAVDVLV